MCLPEVDQEQGYQKHHEEETSHQKSTRRATRSTPDLHGLPEVDRKQRYQKYPEEETSHQRSTRRATRSTPDLYDLPEAGQKPKYQKYSMKAQGTRSTLEINEENSRCQRHVRQCRIWWKSLLS